MILLLGIRALTWILYDNAYVARVYSDRGSKCGCIIYYNLCFEENARYVRVVLANFNLSFLEIQNPR